MDFTHLNNSDKVFRIIYEADKIHNTFINNRETVIIPRTITVPTKSIIAASLSVSGNEITG